MKIILTEHAKFEAQRRQIKMEIIEKIAQKPQQVLSSAGNKLIFQGKYYDAIEKKEMLLRLVIKEEKRARKIITVYKTSKIEKYWERGE